MPMLQLAPDRCSYGSPKEQAIVRVWTKVQCVVWEALVFWRRVWSVRSSRGEVGC